MFRFAQPEYLYLLLIVPLIWVLYFYSVYKKKKNLAKFGHVKTLEPLMPDVSKYKPGTKFFLQQLDQLILMDPAKRIDGMQGAIVSDDTHLHKVEISESMYPTVDDVIQNLIQRALEPFEAEAGRLSPEERISIVEELYKNGLFVLKGSVYALAKALEVSEPTVYRYLNRVKKNNPDSH